ncbi:MAG: aspartate aminotransferase family protein [Planctomycetota bacterium]|jgi:sulfinoalanine decarboxylase|nr:aspartate aminotransferase family protein [Planctomycetota bacterium]MDP6940629.1 aspartate aminotransferase family protein [Planctomycetota bacterium]
MANSALTPNLGIDRVLAQAAELASDYLREHKNRDQPVVDWLPPERLREELGLTIPVFGRGLEAAFAEAQTFLQRSVRTGHPYFLNQLYTGSDPAALVGEWIASLANASMYTYEVAPVFTLVEEELVRKMGKMAGWDDCEGIFNPGGSLSNLMAVLAARNAAFPHAKQRGLRGDDRPVFFCSEEAHYSVPRAASVVGIGMDAARKVPVDSVGRMCPDALEGLVQDSIAEGFTPFMVSATCGTTMPGAFDPLNALADVCEKYSLWLHADAAFGGSVLFSEKYRGLMAGVERANSLSWNPHKTMGVPLSCSALLLPEKGRLKATNALDADYLFHDTAEACCDRGDMTLQCGRRVDVLKLWLSWQSHGDEGYRGRVEQAFEMTTAARDLVELRDSFELAREPEGCTLLFRFLPPSLRGQERDGAWIEKMERANITLRERLKHEGRIMLNYAGVDGIATLRLVLTHPDLTVEDLRFVLDEMEKAGANL